MIRVLHVVTHMNRGGLETMLMNYYRHIDRTQIQFDFLTHREYDGDYGEEIKSLGGIIYHLPVMNPFSVNYLKSLDSFLKNHPEYQIIHVHQDCMSSVILKVAQKNGVKVRIAHSHNANQDRNIKYPIKMFYKRSISKYATYLMACSKDAGDWMFGGAPFTVLNNAIDAKKYVYDSSKSMKQREKLGINQGELLVGHVGRFSLQKNHQYLIDIFYQLQTRVPAKLILVGDKDGSLAKNIEEKVANLGIQDKVIFTGLRSDVEDLMQAMDVFVFPSLYEGLPVSVIEAQASGLPCIISDKVPIQCKVTKLVEQVKLTDDLNTWVDRIVSALNTERIDSYQIIKEARFDIEENAHWLQSFYKG